MRGNRRGNCGGIVSAIAEASLILLSLLSVPSVLLVSLVVRSSSPSDSLLLLDAAARVVRRRLFHVVPKVGGGGGPILLLMLLLLLLLLRAGDLLLLRPVARDFFKGESPCWKKKKWGQLFVVCVCLGHEGVPVGLL